MNKQVELFNKNMTVTLSSAALEALEQRKQPLIAEMELYFSCLIRKQVRFRDTSEGELFRVTEQLFVHFRPVMTASCGIDYEGDEPPLTDFPIQKVASFVPNWLNIDFKHGQWQGEFGF